MVIASHEPELVESLATRAVTVTGGRVTAERPIGASARPAAPSAVDPVPTLPGTGQAPGGQVAHVA